MTRRGDKYIQRSPEARWPIFIEVTRVGRAGWVDIRCVTWAMTWTKRMPDGLEPMLREDSAFRIVREDWSMVDVFATVPPLVPKA